MASIKQVAKALVPKILLKPLRRGIRNVRNRLIKKAVTEYDDQFKDLSPAQAFTKIYHEHVAWGKSEDPAQVFFSGLGSHSPDIIDPYIQAVGIALSALPTKPDVVDLGCGDFNVGSRIRKFCGSYIACDIVEPLIAYNRVRYKDIDVDFRVLDLTKDELPKADIIFLRQVLQHLSNEQISKTIPQISSKYKYLILSEHVPKGEFIPNLDKSVGPDIRLKFNSGIVLTCPPFNLRVVGSACICEVEQSVGFPLVEGVIRTNLYRLG